MEGGRQDAHAGPLATVLTAVTEIRPPWYSPASRPHNRWNVVEVEEFLTWRLSATVLTSDSLRYKGAMFVQHEAIRAPSKASSETRMLTCLWILEGEQWVRGRLSALCIVESKSMVLSNDSIRLRTSLGVVRIGAIPRSAN